MITYKNQKEIKIMRVAGKMLHQVLQGALKKVVPGASTAAIDQWIEAEILKLGGEPGFKLVKGYHWASCISINEYVVHTPPSSRIIRDGDVVTIDSGVFLQGLHTDAAWTVQAGKPTDEVTRFLEAGAKAVYDGIAKANPGNHIGDISQAIQAVIETAGYSIVRELSGHGVGRELHEEPTIPCFLNEPIEKTPKIRPGMTLAIEVMYGLGGRKITHDADGWSIKMADDTIAASFEHTVLIAGQKGVILTG